MSKRRNKPNKGNDRKILDAQHKNDFFRRLSCFCKDVAGEDVLMHIPPQLWNVLYEARPRVITGEPEKGNDIPPELIDSIKIHTKYWFTILKINIKKTNREVYFSNYFEFAFPLSTILSYLESINHKNYPKVKELLDEDFGDLKLIITQLHTKIVMHILSTLTMVANDFALEFYSFRFLFEVSKFDLRSLSKVIVTKYPCQMIHTNIDNHSRPVFRVGWTFPENSLEWAAITAAKLGINSIPGDKEISVYIQKHALQRLEERLDCLPLSTLQFSIYISLRYGKVIREKDCFLIEFEILQTKVGYLNAILINDKLIIRTFLFLTCVGTPEGKRLEEFVGLKKLDTAYLKMDKLSTFMMAKLSSNPEVRSVFEKADCIHLIELFEKLEKVVMKRPEHTPLEMIAQYIKKGDEKENNWDFEEIDQEL